MRIHKFWKQISILLVVVLAVAGMSVTPRTASAQAKTELVYGSFDTVDVLDPNVTSFSAVGGMMAQVVEGLTWEPKLGTIVPGLASSWKVSADVKEYTFNLRKDVKFQDGTPFNAQAVKFTFDRIANPDTKSQTAASLIGPYQETQVVDDYTVVVKFKQPYSPFLSNAATPYLGIVSPTAFQKAGAEWGKTVMVGSGPFKVQSFTPDSELVLVKNPDYNWAPDFFGVNGAAKLDKITFKIIQEPATRLAALENGDVDFIDQTPETDVKRLKDGGKFTVVQIEQPGSGWSLMMNVTKAPTDDLAVRKAIALGSDKQGMIDTVFNGLGTPGCSPLTKVMFGYDPKSCTYLPYDPTQAAKVLDDDGWKMGSDGIRAKNGQPLVLEHWFRSDSPTNVAMATFMQADLKKLGIKVNLNGAARAGYFDAVRSGKHNTQNWWDTQTEPDAMIRTLLSSDNADGGTNRNRYKNPKMDALIDAASSTVDLQKRADLYAQIQKLEADDAVMVFYDDPYLFYSQTPKLQGAVPLGGGTYIDFYAASFK
ncbi:MAG TPA: ABC transporter substrate-binding protein [Aggregatilineales bacterium]|nr:ABC transporter substrate-binding protein [Aggregatilineales bacterium]